MLLDVGSWELLADLDLRACLGGILKAARRKGKGEAEQRKALFTWNKGPTMEHGGREGEVMYLLVCCAQR